MQQATRSMTRSSRPAPEELSSEEEELSASSFNNSTSFSQQGVSAIDCSTFRNVLTAFMLIISECSVCLSQMELPIRLPCSHYFCYTCAKGLAQTNRSCAMCRGQIPQDFLQDPDKYVVGIIKEPNLEFAWFYEGSHGKQT